MLWAKNKGNFSVIFTEESADQTLLAAIEKELNSTQYQTFSNLCKQALWQFLSVSELGGVNGGVQRLEERLIELQQKWTEFEKRLGSTMLRPVSTTPSQPIPPLSFPNLDSLEKHLGEIERKLVALETYLSQGEGVNHWQSLEQQLSQLSQQMILLQGTVDHININAPNAIPDFSPVVLESSSKEQVETPIYEESQPQEIDPVLSRLGGLLDAF